MNTLRPTSGSDRAAEAERHVAHSIFNGYARVHADHTAQHGTVFETPLTRKEIVTQLVRRRFALAATDSGNDDVYLDPDLTRVSITKSSERGAMNLVEISVFSHS